MGGTSHLPCEGGEIRRHGEYVYHLECDPRERARFREQANKALAAGEQKTLTDRVTGALAEARAARRLAARQAVEAKRRELEQRYQDVEDQQQQEPGRRLS